MTRRMVGEGDPFYLKCWLKNCRHWSENANFLSIFAVRKK